MFDPLVRQLCLVHRDAIPPALASAIRAAAKSKAKPYIAPVQQQVSDGTPITPAERKPPRSLVLALIREVAEKHGLTVAKITGNERTPRISHPRQEAFYRLRVDLRMSRPEIGNIFGGKDHTTVLHGIRAHAKRTGLPDPTRHVVKQ